MLMITQKPAASRLPLRVASTAFAALLVLGLPLAAQGRGGHGGGGGGGGRSAHSTGGGSHSGGNSGGGSSSGGHTAHGVPGGGSNGGQHQPGTHGGFHGGHGFYGHGFYYPYYGFGIWPSFSWWWYDDPYYYPGYYGYPGYGGYGGGYDHYDHDRAGALDLDVSPGRTHVFVNGEDLGIVDRYDGWPGYLWLPKGTYDVAFYLDGYKTIARQITIYPGTVVDIDDRMEHGESIRPEDLVSKSHARRDERMNYERQRREELQRQDGDDEDQGWRDRVRHDRGAMRDDDDQGQDMDRHDTDRHEGRYDDRHDGPRDSSRAHLRLSVEPQDASVYLDGQFVGTGTDLSLLHAGLPIAPGTHRLSVVRPGHKAVEKEFDVKDGGDVRLDIALEGGPGR
jgi:hypothetical protein